MLHTRSNVYDPLNSVLESLIFELWFLAIVGFNDSCSGVTAGLSGG